VRSIAGETSWIQQALLSCGVLAPLVYLGTDLLAGRLLTGYSFSARSSSDLSASGSPVRSLVVALTCVACALMVAFAIGVWRAANGALPARAVAVLLAANAILGLIAIVFFPTRYGERPALGTPGVILSLLSVVCFVLAMVVGAIAFDGWLRILSIAIPVGYVVLAVARFATATPENAVSLIGAQERTMAFSFLLWVVALAISLLLASGSGGSPSPAP
jgi:hypothetical protein